MFTFILISIIVIFFIRFACYGFTSFIFGCGRRFKNGRKCAMWSCPNSAQCEFSKYYLQPKKHDAKNDKSEDEEEKELIENV